MNIKSLGLEIKIAVEAEGGTCLPIWTSKTLTIAIQEITPDRVQELLTPYLEAFGKPGQAPISIVQTDEESLPQGTLPTNWSGPGSIIRQRLTRKFLIGLLPGAYVVSNCYSPTGRSIFAEQVGDVRSRDKAWKRALDAGAAQRLCQVLWTAEEFQKAASPRREMPL